MFSAACRRDPSGFNLFFDTIEKKKKKRIAAGIDSYLEPIACESAWLHGGKLSAVLSTFYNLALYNIKSASYLDFMLQFEWEKMETHRAFLYSLSGARRKVDEWVLQKNHIYICLCQTNQPVDISENVDCSGEAQISPLPQCLLLPGLCICCHTIFGGVQYLPALYLLFTKLFVYTIEFHVAKALLQRTVGILHRAVRRVLAGSTVCRRISRNVRWPYCTALNWKQHVHPQMSAFWSHAEHMWWSSSRRSRLFDLFEHVVWMHGGKSFPGLVPPLCLTKRTALC